MISNNFVELKGSVFKKFDKNNLFQVACSDVRERFHLFVLLSIVVLQTMKEYAWKEETLWVMVPDCLMVLISEIIVDWIKHAFITRFNELPVEVYRDYRLSLAYDMAQTRQKNAFTDHSDLVARRMGFIPLPLGVVMVRVLGNAVKIQGGTAITLAALGYCCLASFKILNNILLLGKACDLIYQHQQEKTQQDSLNPIRFNKDSATSPTRPQVIRSPSPGLQRSVTVPGTPEHSKRTEQEVPNEQLTNLVSPAIFSNSAVSITDVCLNEEMLRVGFGAQLESIGEADYECMTRSVPNIQQETDLEIPNTSRSASPSPELGKKRAESEPSIPLLIENEIAEAQTNTGLL
uniref:Protein TAPT1 homolog n=1 Tax=Clastoptera arizonana TaxID=38151 RepID=A0A1B6C086_9HEMI